MKTTFDIPEPLLRRVQELARERKSTTKSLVEEALRALVDRSEAAAGYSLPDRAVAGDGLNPEFEGAAWETVREAAYGQRL